MKDKNRIYLNIKVQTRSAKQEIIRMDSHLYRVRVSAAPDKGEANKEVIKLIAAHFGLPPSLVEIVRGHTSRNKVVALPRTYSKN